MQDHKYKLYWLPMDSLRKNLSKCVLLPAYVCFACVAISIFFKFVRFEDSREAASFIKSPPWTSRFARGFYA